MSVLIRDLIFTTPFAFSRFRYPLAFAAYSNDVYGCLRDRSDNVRLAALKTISNLILKEMVKVSCVRVSDLASFSTLVP